MAELVPFAYAVLLICANLVITFATGNQDIALSLAFLSAFAYGFAGDKTRALPLTQNTSAIMGILLLLILLSYRVMFDLIEVQSYIVTASAVRSGPVLFGAILVQLLILGASIGSLVTKRAGHWRAGMPSTKSDIGFGYLVASAWVPLVINILVYIIVFRQRDYVEVHTMMHGPIGLLMKTIYITYAALILLATGNYAGDKAYASLKKIIVGYIIVYGILLHVRSPLLCALLLFVYFYGSRFSFKLLAFSAIGAILLFAMIGLLRDQNAGDSSGVLGILNSVLGLGEFTDTLRFAMEQTDAGGTLWGSGIIGSFLGTSEPVANVYAKMIAPDYFDEGGGFGFFFLADLVFNFGKIGAAIFIFIAGFWLARLHSTGRGMRSYILLPTLFGNLFAFARNDFGSTFRGVVYILLAVAMVKVGWYFARSIQRVWHLQVE